MLTGWHDVNAPMLRGRATARPIMRTAQHECYESGAIATLMPDSASVMSTWQESREPGSL